MGLYIGAGPKGESVAERIGMYGSGQIFIAHLFAGYALSQSPDWKRAIRWIRCLRFGRFAGPDGDSQAREFGLPIEFNEHRTLDNLRKLLAFSRSGVGDGDDDGQWSWLVLEASGGWGNRKRQYSFETGFKQKKPKCRLLTALCRLAQATANGMRTQGNNSTLPRHAVIIDQAYSVILPFLKESAWYSKMQRLYSTIHHAAQTKTAISIS